ncbi:hypothetical protein HPB48_022681 [Haemaphysalis longicornis]|uniref:Transposase Tc1-like domain-containing protein n=1 Tax=Haemaphysalis longicornis TaxID=44386 RepID=A0A9J6G8K6_HAELO|nr:hypothetical protein HPB48_022681 [Haemaphysalis longicornis]
MSRVPDDQRRKIVDLSLQAYTQRQISEMTNRPLSTVSRIVQAYRKERRIKDAPRKAPPKVTTEDEDMAIVAAAVDCPTATVREIKSSAGLEGVSDTTVKRRLYESGLKSRTAVQNPTVSEANKKKTRPICSGTPAMARGPLGEGRLYRRIYFYDKVGPAAAGLASPKLFR